MNYCVGLIFNENLSRILLVKKNRGPECVKNRLNGIGGKIEQKDLFPLNAMSRECKEETGIDIHPNKWVYFCELDCNEGKIYFYYIVLSDDSFYSYKQMEDEEIKDYGLGKFMPQYFCEDDFDFLPHVANLDWLIQMALNHYRKLDPAKSFLIKEVFQ